MADEVIRIVVEDADLSVGGDSSPVSAGGSDGGPASLLALTGTGGTAAGTASAAGASGGALGGLAAAAGPLALLAIAAMQAKEQIQSAFSSVADAAKGLVNSVNEQVRELQGYSAELSFAAAEGEIAREQTKFERAERLGPQLAEFESTRQEFEQISADVWTEILQVGLDLFSMLKPFIEFTVETLKSIFEYLKKTYDTIREWMGFEIDKELDAKADLMDPFADQLLAQIEGRQLF